ncbi:hypothetical protein BS78_01G499100 [Paspalum vaginatum]|nr:hypothetical protein BS78_01G499100 [Paspalum vaginatum]
MMAFLPLQSLTVISMLSPKEVARLLRLLWHLPRLVDLMVWSRCSTSSDFKDDALLSSRLTMETVPCVTLSLHHLSVGDFGGHQNEIAFVAGMLARATHLARVTLISHTKLTTEAATAAVHLEMYPRANENCEVLMEKPRIEE